MGEQMQEILAEMEKRCTDLDLISATVHCGCMGLPQELIDHIMQMLHDDRWALKACSLTCKTMFASTRHFIHQTLQLTRRNDQSVLPPGGVSQYKQWGHHELSLCFLSHMGKRDLLKYTRRVHIWMPRGFVPDVLLPHLHHFQSLDHVHTLIIDHHEAASWTIDGSTFFVHFYSTLTSLALRRPVGNHRLLLQFALQFPNLENLSLELLEEQTGENLTLPIPTYRSPHPRGHLRLAGVDTVRPWPTDLVQKLPNGVNFRSIELEDFRGDRAQQVLDACAHTIESVRIVGCSARQLLSPL